jgi:hypothetical protein
MPTKAVNNINSVFNISSGFTNDCGVKSKEGFNAKIYGIMNAAIASLVAVTAVLSGLDFAIAAPA